MKSQTILMYLVILCIIVSMGYKNESILHTQVNQGLNNHNQVFTYHVNQKNNLKHPILTTTNNKQVNSQSIQRPSGLQTINSVEASSNGKEFSSVWNTQLASLTSSNSNQIRLPLVSNGTYDFTVSWGDGNSNLITSYNQPAVTHTYSAPGNYTVNISGTIVGWSFNGLGDAIKLIQILNWGPLRLGNSGYYFKGANNLYLTTTGALDLNGTTNLAGMFEYCGSLGSSGNLNSWNVSQVTDMSHMFNYANFNQPLNLWNVSQVTDMSFMFAYTASFNQPLNSWNVSNVTDMSYMFDEAFFNQPLNAWNVSNVTDMNHMFSYSNYNQPLNLWNVSQVTNMNHMFFNSVDFNQPLDSWNVSQVTDMSAMFYGTWNFNQPLNSWDVSKVNYMNSMFGFTSSFNQPLDSWNVSQVYDMNSMFTNAFNFNQSLNSWDVSQVADMYIMFDNAIHFNHPLNSWNVSQVTNMRGMFSGATAFNQPLNSWNVSKVTDMSNLFSGDTLSVANYDSLLLGWSTLPNLQHNINFDAGFSMYGTSAQNAREKLISNFGWTISDGGLFTPLTSSFNSFFITLLIIIAVVTGIVIPAYVSSAYFEYKEIKTKKHKKELKFWNYLKNRSYYKKITIEPLIARTPDKITNFNQIIYCSQCGETNIHKDLFCQNCGSRL